MTRYNIVQKTVLIPIEDNENIKKGVTINKPYIESRAIEPFDTLEDATARLKNYQSFCDFNNENNNFTIIEYHLEEYSDNDYVKTHDFSDMLFKVKNTLCDTFAKFDTFADAYQHALKHQPSFIDCDGSTISVPIDD